ISRHQGQQKHPHTSFSSILLHPFSRFFRNLVELGFCDNKFSRRSLSSVTFCLIYSLPPLRHLRYASDGLPLFPR
ncbi:hypothetical protein PMAYCL1PPCAC_04582, partial [Pristionchus mayeri]